MHPVITDQLDHHAVVAQAVVDSEAARPQLLELLATSYHLFRNFMVLAACGLFESPKHMAQAVLSYTDASLRETFPHAIAAMEAETSLLDLDDAIDQGRDFAEATLFYVGGLPYLRIFDATGEACDGFDPKHLEPKEDNFGSYDCATTPDAATTGTLEAFATTPAKLEAHGFDSACGVFSARTVSEVEAEMNTTDTARYGPLSSAALDYNHLRAKQLCGMTLTSDEWEAFPQLHGMVVEEAAARIVRQRVSERRQAQEIAEGNEAQSARFMGASEAPTFRRVLLTFAARYLAETPGADLNAVARVCARLIAAPPELQVMFAGATCFLSVSLQDDGGFGILLDNGIGMSVVCEGNTTSVFGSF